MAEVVSAFVEVPQKLRERLPVVYGGLRSVLRQDPAAWADQWERGCGQRS
jgi:Mlc titration factor MtfA (ptsG expression regulator)